MKKFYFLIVLLLMFGGTINSQVWKLELPDKKGNDYTFFDYQKAFNNYCAKYKLNNQENEFNQDPENETFGIPGYSRFKRWEWYWKYRVDPKTGKFPNVTANTQYKKWIKANPQAKNTVQGNWTNIGPSNVNSDGVGTGRINCITFDPNNTDHYWVGAPAGGVWETTDNGASWTVLTDNNEVLGVSTILLPSDYNASTNPTIYIGTGDRDGGSLWGMNGGQTHDNESVGVLKSTDGGSTWQATGLTFNITSHATVGKLVGDPNNPDIIWAATNYGIYKTTDGGTTWALKKADAFIDLEMKPDDNNILYASTSVFGTPYPRIYRSDDAGETWSIIQQFNIDEYRIDLTVTANDPNAVYAVVSMTDYSNSYSDYGSLYGIYKSSDAGLSYTQVYDGTATNHNLCGWYTDGSDAGGQGDYDLAFVANPNNANELYFGGVNGFKSTDGAQSWTAVSCWTTSTTYNKNGAALVHADHHMMQYRQDGALFDCNDGGVYYTTDGGSTWTNITPGLVNGQLYGIGVAQTTANEILGGYQDNGTKRTKDNGSNWDDVASGDGMKCDICQDNVNYQVGSYAGSYIWTTTNDWGSSGSVSVDADWAFPIMYDPAGGTVYFWGDDEVCYYKTSHPGIGRKTISKNIASSGGDKLTCLDVYHVGSNYVFYASDGTSIWKSPVITDYSSSSNFTKLTTNFNNKITHIEIDPDDYNHVWVTLGGYDGNRVYETTDGGTNWSNISEGLPEVPCMTIVKYTGNTSEDELYLGTDIGVFVKQGTSPWVYFNSGMPRTVVTDLKFYYGSSGTTDDVLYAGTFGRGVWKSDPYSCPTLDAAISSIIVPADNYCDLNSSPIAPQVVLANIGSTTLTSCNISYIVDGGSPVVYNWTGSLTKGQSEVVTLANLTLTYGVHSFEAYVSDPNGGTDQNSVNDTQTKTYNIWDNSLDYSQTFDNFTLATAYLGDPAVDLQECWTNDESGDTFDWSVATGGTPSANTGPQSGDHTSGSGKFLYTETSGISSTQTADLLSPVFDLTNYSDANISFWYYMYGSNIGTLSVDMYYNGSWHNSISVSWDGTSATSISGDQGQMWHQATADVSAAVGYSDVQFRFHSTTLNSSATYGDMSIDDFSISGTAVATCTYPTTQANTFAATPYETTIDLSWTRGTGDNVIVLAHEGAPVDSDPVDGVSYTANATFGSGTQIGGGNYVVYDGSSTGVTVTGLTANTNYYFAIYEYNSSGPCYLTPALTGNKLTLPAQPSAITGATDVCENDVETYSVTDVAGVTFTWTFPSGWVINSGQGTNSVNVTVGNTSGNITVTPSNSSGNGTAQTLTTTVSLLPTDPSTVSASPTTITSGNSSTLSYTGGSGTTFSWYSGSCGGTLEGTGNNLVVSPTSTTTYYGRWENSCGQSNCLSVTVTVTTLKWDGSTSSDWQDVTNWTPEQIPTSTDDITIPNSCSHYPIINNGISQIAECNNITIENAASLTVAPNGYLTINGAITNNAGNAGLIILSDATGTGSLIQNSGTGIDATVQRYLAATTKAWHMLGSPILSAPVSVFPTTSNLYYYNEAANDYWTGANYDSGSEMGWTAFTSGNMVVGQGYLFNYTADTLTFTGQLNTNTAGQNITLNYTNNGVNAPNSSSYTDFDGWNLVSNPFTSAIDWTAVDANAANLYNAIYVWDAANATYKSFVVGTDSWDNTGTNGGSQYIPAMQGFFVKIDESISGEVGGTLNIPPSARTHDTQAFWKSNINNVLRLAVNANNLTDETLIRLSDNATIGMDNHLDAYKLFSYEVNAPQIYTVNENRTEFSINTLPIQNNIFTVPLRVYTNSEKFTLSIKELNFENYNLFLIDNSNTGIDNTIAITPNNNYSFNTNGNETENRFEILFVPKNTTNLKDFTQKVFVFPNPSQNIFNIITNNGNESYSLSLISRTGQVLKTIDSQSNLYKLDLSNYDNGMYFIRIQYENKESQVLKIIKK